MSGAIQINEHQTVQIQDHFIFFDLVLVTKADKWYRKSHRETIFSHKDTHSYAAFLTACDRKEDELSWDERMYYDFDESFNAERILLTSLEDNPSGTVDVLRNFPNMDYMQKVEAYELMYNYVMDRIDRDKERQSLLRDVGLDPVENMRQEQIAMKQAHKVLNS